MSAEACVAFYGLRFEVAGAEVPGLEARSDPRLQSARKFGLKTYWGNFGLPGERYLLFIGSRLAVLGPENDASLSMDPATLAGLVDETDRKLEAAGFRGAPALHIEWMPDA